jgi:hypothetical protein
MRVIGETGSVKFFWIAYDCGQKFDLYREIPSLSES